MNYELGNYELGITNLFTEGRLRMKACVGSVVSTSLNDLMDSEPVEVSSCVDSITNLSTEGRLGHDGGAFGITDSRLR